MSAVKLPRGIEDKLAELAAGVRRLWLLRGLCLFALVLLLAGGAAVLADAKFDLPGWGRGGLLAGWLAILAVAGWRWVWRPLRSPVPVPALAAAIERHFPSLAERLTTLVELSEGVDAGNGSRALIDVLAKDTAQRTKRLNFFRAAPTAATVRAGAVAFVVMLLVLSPLVLVPGAAERVRRFLLPWYVPAVDAPYRVVVSSGDPVVKRGEGVTLTAVLERQRPDAELPDAAVLVYREGDGPERKLPMTGDEKAAFHVTRPEVQGGFTYRVEAGPAKSDDHTVTVIDPVELAEGTTFTLTPPEYARVARPPLTVPGLSEFEGVQFSKVRFEFKFSRPAVSAFIDWKPSDPNGVIDGERYTATLNADKTGGTLDWTLVADGTLKLVLLGERQVRTEVIVATRAVVDDPPKFERVGNVTDRPREVRPDDRVPIELTVTDDFGVAAVAVEYQVNAEAVKSVPVPLKGIGTTKADGRWAFELAGRAKDGDTVRFRVRATDNREVPAFGKRPQESVYPEKGWSLLRVNPAAKPLLEQDALGERDKLKEKLKELQGEVADAKRGADGLAQDAAGKAELDRGDQNTLEDARARAKKIAGELDELAREAALTPALRPLADAMRAAADQAVRKADDELRKAANEPDKAARNKQLKAAADALADAADRLNKLVEQNDRLARDRLDRDKLERLAAEQRKLAAEAREHAGDPAKAADIARRQRDIEAELDALMRENETLRKAAEEAAGADARALADRAKALADAQKQLDQANRDLDGAARKKAIDEAAGRQKEAERKAADLAEKTQREAKVAGAEPLDRQPLDAAADKLNKGDAVGAMTEQEKAARELDRLADALEKAAAARKDPKEAAKQLAKLEDELRKQAADAKTAGTPEQRKAAQEAVRRAADAVTPPPGDAAAAKAKKEAVEKLQQAADAQGTDRADAAMGEAADALRKLADALPSREQRLAKAKSELEKLQREQDAVRREAEEKGKGLDKKTPDAATRKEASEKLADAAKKQAEIAEKLAGLDAPGLERRRDRAAEAARQAADDLKQGRTQDTQASQADAKRQADRLGQAMSGQQPADVVADEAAKRQREVADAAAKLKGKPSPDQLQRMQQQEQEIERQLDGVKEPDAAEALSRGREAVRAAAEAAKKGDADELKKKTQDAADALDRLADDLGGAESDAARADRLAKERQQSAERAQRNAGKPPAPGEAEAAKAELDRQADELRRTRAGDGGQEAKKKAADALDKLRKSPTPDRAPGLQKAAADAMKDLADGMNGRGDRTAKNERGDPDAAPADDAGGQLPSKADADAARDAAKAQRNARDKLAEANERAGKGTPPTDNAKLDKLAGEQKKLADEAAELAKEAGGRAAPKAAEAAKQAADGLANGAVEPAQAAGERAAEGLEQAAREAGDTPAGRKAKELADKQAGLNRKVAEQAGDAGAAAAQQKARQAELAKEANDLADKLDRAAENPQPGGKGDPGATKKAADAAREAGREMDRAGREQAAGRAGNAAEAREKAGEAAAKAAGQAAAAAGPKPDGDGKPDDNAADAGRAMGEAGKEMKQAEKQLGKKDGKSAGQSMDKAADKLDEAADKLAQAGKPGEGGGQSGEGGEKPGQPGQPGGKTPGGNDGSAKGAVTTDIPSDLAKYAGKPWGELPGDVKARILQDLQAKYGEDYARAIKLYFEQLAERK